MTLNILEVCSQGNFSVNVDSFKGMKDLALLSLVGRTGWREKKLIRGYDPTSYDRDSSKKISDFHQHFFRCIGRFSRRITCGKTVLNFFFFRRINKR